MKPTKITLTIGPVLSEKLRGLGELTGRSRADLVEALVEKGMNTMMHDMSLHLGAEAERARGPATSKTERAG